MKVAGRNGGEVQPVGSERAAVAFMHCIYNNYRDN